MKEDFLFPSPVICPMPSPHLDSYRQTKGFKQRVQSQLWAPLRPSDTTLPQDSGHLKPLQPQTHDCPRAFMGLSSSLLLPTRRQWQQPGLWAHAHAGQGPPLAWRGRGWGSGCRPGASCGQEKAFAQPTHCLSLWYSLDPNQTPDASVTPMLYILRRFHKLSHRQRLCFPPI